jgi:endonuclease III
VTAASSARLFGLAATPYGMLRLSRSRIARAIYPAGFYRVKARHILGICRDLVARHRGEQGSPCAGLASARGERSLPIAKANADFGDDGFGAAGLASACGRRSRPSVVLDNAWVPSGMDDLLALKGVGRKTANLVRGRAFGIPAICVDTHVHRIPNRMGLVRTTKPEETERMLMRLLPRDTWIGLNELLVGHGQRICRPRGPRCTRCKYRSHCLRRC